nr:MAG TPA_asm: hypothetical protein [Bacteriophage sp.]
MRIRIPAVFFFSKLIKYCPVVIFYLIFSILIICFVIIIYI